MLPKLFVIERIEIVIEFTEIVISNVSIHNLYLFRNAKLPLFFDIQVTF